VAVKKGERHVDIFVAIKDPIGISGGLNLYQAFDGNGINLKDPDGLAVGSPGTLEGFIPVWGAGRQAINDFQTGHYVWGTVNTVVAVSDVFLVKAAATGIAKGAWKVGSHSWRATRAWMGKTGRAKARQQVHHWAIPQGRWGRHVPNALKNQPWNLMPMKNSLFHQSVHGIGRTPFGPVEQLIYGTPSWFKALLISEYGRIANETREENQNENK